MSAFCRGLQECITRSGARHSGEWRFGHPHGPGIHFDPASGVTLEGNFLCGKFVAENSSGFGSAFVAEEDLIDCPSQEVQRLAFGAFEKYPLIKCPLLQPPTGGQFPPWRRSPGRSPRS